MVADLIFQYLECSIVQRYANSSIRLAFLRVNPCYQVTFLSY